MNNEQLVDPAMPSDKQEWMRNLASCFEASTTYIDSNIRSNWARDIAHFQNRHAGDSKFNTPAYAKRNKVFRPKTRMASRNAEATTAGALFSTSDLIDVRAVNEADPVKAAGAAAHKALLQYRLENTIPWFLTAVGARQDCFVYGICATYQHWQFEEMINEEYLLNDDGSQMTDEMGNPLVAQRRETVLDRPWIDMIPPENLRFDPDCDWRDPVKSSAYLIWIQPTYLDDVLAKIDKGEWLPHERDTIKSASSEMKYDTTKNERDRGRPTQGVTETPNPVVYVHVNFMRKDKQDYVFWTIGTTLMLTEPVPIKEKFPIGERPIVIGRTVIETHHSYPSSDAGLTADLQAAGNEVANQRFDNVQLVLNKRYVLKRGKQIDVDALMRNVPGGGIVTDDPNGDVRMLETPDVTASSYQEQDRFDVQMDEMQGVFSGSSVQSNRALNETVGGMNLLGSSASAISEYTMRVFVETWVEPVLRQLVKLESAYETDATVIAIAGETAKETLQRFGFDRITDEMLMSDAMVRVNVGTGSTNPQQKIDRIMVGIKTVAELPGVAERIKPEEIIKEVFGALGYQNGERFFVAPEDVEQTPPPEDPMVAVRMRELELREQEMKANALHQRNTLIANDKRAAAELMLKRELGYAQIAASSQSDAAKIMADVRKAGLQAQTNRDIRALTETNRANEMELKRSMGSGI